MGLRRSGKSSIQKVVFHKMSPSETLFLESTNKICREDVSSSSFVSFQIWDFPGQIDFFDPTFDYEMIFRGTGALIFVIDSQVSSQGNTVKQYILLSCYYNSKMWLKVCSKNPKLNRFTFGWFPHPGPLCTVTFSEQLLLVLWDMTTLNKSLSFHI